MQVKTRSCNEELLHDLYVDTGQRWRVVSSRIVDGWREVEVAEDTTMTHLPSGHTTKRDK